MDKTAILVWDSIKLVPNSQWITEETLKRPSRSKVWISFSSYLVKLPHSREGWKLRRGGLSSFAEIVLTETNVENVIKDLEKRTPFEPPQFKT